VTTAAEDIIRMLERESDGLQNTLDRHGNDDHETVSKAKHALNRLRSLAASLRASAMAAVEPQTAIAISQGAADLKTAAQAATDRRLRAQLLIRASAIEAFLSKRGLRFMSARTT